jgi:phosphoribosylformylglycinamidine cyclo-ligase
MSDQYKYDLRGVSATKDDVHAAIKGMDKGLYPNAFCKILPDYTAGDDDYVNLMHADTAGTKTSLAYLYWKETGDLSVWKGIAQDALIMNLDDMACVGCVDNIVISSTIGRNRNKISGEVIGALINASNELAAMLKSHGVNIHLAGGETADVGDIVRTIDVGITAFARMKKSDLIINDIQPGDMIVGLSSSGQATYEDEYNGGMGSNGLTSARHDILNYEYAEKYPESFDSATPKEAVYIGNKKLTDEVMIDGKPIHVGKLILSPTRTYLPVLQKIIPELKEQINGLIHATGGGQVKVNHFIKDRHVIKKEGGSSWKEMYQVFNMGHRLEFYLPEASAQRIIEISESFNIDAQIVGRVEAHEGNKVSIKTPEGWVEY